MASRRTPCVFLALCCTAAVLAPARHASAQAAAATPDSPEALMAQGVELRRRGDDEGALATFRRAYDATHSGQALGQVALAEQALGRWVDAERDMTQALATNDPWIARNRATLESALQTVARRLGSLMVVANVPGAEVYANAQRVGTLPLAAPLRVPVGSVVIEIRHPRYLPLRRTVEMEPGGSHRESFDLVPRAEDEGAPSNATSAVTHPSANTNASTAPAEHASSTRGTVGLAALVGGGVLLVGGVIAHVYWQNRVALYNDDSQCFRFPLTREERCGAVLDNANVGKGLTIGLYTAGGVIAAAGAILLMTAPSSRAADVARACGGGPGDVGVSCAVRF